MNATRRNYSRILSSMHEWVFLAFLFTAPFSVRKILYSFPISGKFNEYTSIYIYASDIVLLLAIIFWCISILCNIYLFSSRYTDCSTWNNCISNLFHVEQVRTNNTPQVIHRLLITLPIVLITLAALSITYSELRNIAIFRTFKLIEFFLLFLYLASFVPRGTLTKRILWITIASGSLNSIIAILQFIYQKSIGLQFLGESIISPTLPGVAKVIFTNETFMRSYGLFPHPNILGGFLLISIIFTLYYNNLFHVEQYTAQTNSNMFLFHVEHLYSKIRKIVPRGTIIVIQFVALFLTFSKSAWIALIISLLYKKITSTGGFSKMFHVEQFREMFHARFTQLFHVEQLSKLKTRTSFLFHVEQKANPKHEKELFHVEQFYILFILFGLIAALFLYKDIYNNLSKSLLERNFYINVSRGTILEHPFAGIGMGQYVVSLMNLRGILDYQFQPVHNIYFLLSSELGTPGLIIFAIFIIALWNCSTWNNSKANSFKQHLKAILLGMLIIFLFDHYYWDIQQGSIFFWIVLGLLV